MESIREIFKGKPYLLEEKEVEKLLNYCEQLEDEIIEFKFDKNNNKELILLDIIKEIIKGCNATEKEQLEHDRFGYEAPDYILVICNLKNYILQRCREEKIWL
jgi:predicted house-cleaning noncanonical NTP pyrophosphatase (MazG superfamily)